MTISCKVCNEHFTEVIDILDKRKALRDASERLQKHLVAKHGNMLQSAQQKAMVVAGLASWILTLRQFSTVIAENQEEVDNAIALVEDSLLCILRGLPPPAEATSKPGN